MKLYLVYQPVLTDEMIDSINRNSTDAGWKQALYQTMRMSETNAQIIADDAARCDLYKLTALAYADDVEQVFDSGNGYPQKPEHRYTRIRKGATSVSVGNLVYDTEMKQMYACCSWGWKVIDIPESMAHNVYTHSTIHMSEVTA